jgi:integrase
LARQQRDFRLQTRDARRRLVAAQEPYWHEIRRGLHVGYRKGRRAGVWWLKEVREGRRTKRRLGIADDTVDADGATVLSWSDAIKVALGEDRPTATAAPQYTVSQALDDYWTFRKAKSPAESVATDRLKARASIEPILGARRVAELATSELEDWRNRLVPTLEDREAQRRAQATANRTWTVLRAALNRAYRMRKVHSAEAWRRIEPFRNVDRARTRFLTMPEALRILDAMQPDFRRLARAALYTGLRLGELCALRCCDVVDGQVHVRNSKGGLARAVPLSRDGKAFFQQVTEGIEPNAPVFMKLDGNLWTRMDVSRRMRAASKGAKLNVPATFHDLRRSYGSLLINRGASGEVIQELLGHADMRMTRRVYAHLLNATIAKTVNKRLPSFGLDETKGRKRST